MSRKELARILGISYDRCIRIVNDYTEPSARERRFLEEWLRDVGQGTGEREHRRAR